MNNFRDRLTQLIAYHNITAYRLAKETKISNATLSRYLNPNIKSKPNESTIMVLSNYFKVDAKWLAEGFFTCRKCNNEFYLHTEEGNSIIYDVRCNECKELIQEKSPSFLQYKPINIMLTEATHNQVKILESIDEILKIFNKEFIKLNKLKKEIEEDLNLLKNN